MNHTPAQPVRNSSGLSKEERQRFFDARESLIELGLAADVWDAIIDARYYGSSVYIPVAEGDPRFAWSLIEAGDQRFQQPVGFIANRQADGTWHLHSGMSPSDAQAFVEQVRGALVVNSHAATRRPMHA